jgi:hypothetical protein
VPDPTDVTASLLIPVLAALGLLGGIGYGIKAFLERRILRAKAGSDDASAASIVAAAARELIDPLRAELALERAQHSGEIEAERRKVALFQRELDTALADVARLRGMLREALDDAASQRRRTLAVERELEQCRAGS